MNVESGGVLKATIERFINQDGQEGFLQSRVLTDFPRGITPNIRGFAAFFPPSEFKVFSDRDLTSFCSKIISLKIPDRMRGMLGVNHPHQRKALEDLCARRRQPSVILISGDKPDLTEKEANILYYVNGMTLEEALEIIQQGVRENNGKPILTTS